MGIEILPIEFEELQRLRSRLLLLRLIGLIFVCPLYMLIMYYVIAALIRMVGSGFELAHLLVLALFVLLNYLLVKFALPFYKIAAEDSKLKKKYVIRARVLKVEAEFVSDMGIRYSVYTDITAPIISTQNVLIFNNVDYSKFVEGKIIEIHAIDMQCKRILSVQF